MLYACVDLAYQCLHHSDTRLFDRLPLPELHLTTSLPTRATPYPSSAKAAGKRRAEAPLPDPRPTKAACHESDVRLSNSSSSESDHPWEPCWHPDHLG